ncbi:nitrate/nitrite transporter NarK [Paraburkholderia atlantica]
MGVVTGIVGLAGGLGGFLLPIIFGILLDFFSVRSTCFMFLYGIVWFL